jgi:hypothetical protein
MSARNKEVVITRQMLSRYAGAVCASDYCGGSLRLGETAVRKENGHGQVKYYHLACAIVLAVS